MCFTAAKRHKHWHLMNPGTAPGVGPYGNCHTGTGGGCSIPLTITDFASTRKCSAKDADLPNDSEDDFSLFCDRKKTPNQDDHHAGNRANVRQN